MGNECEKVCCEGTNLQSVIMSSPNYRRLIKSTLVENNFPEELIPETVKEKINLLNVDYDVENSEVWKYESSKIQTEDSQLIVYTLVSKAGLSKKISPKNQPQSQIVVNKTVPSFQSNENKKVLDPNLFDNATIFIFKSVKSDLSNKSYHSSENPFVPDMTFDKLYYGPVTQFMRSSNGIIILQNGQYYQGNVNDFILEGKGTMKNAIGNHLYQGNWDNNIPNGQGTEIIQGKFKYVGEFSKGKWHGKGTLTLLNLQQLSIQGNFNEGNLEGEGKIFNKQNKLVYEGSFKNGKQHGRGKWYSNNGQLYEGEFIEGRKQGLGRYTFKSGDIYEGTFKDGKPQGEGQLIQGEKRRKGYWYKGQNIMVYKQDLE